MLPVGFYGSSRFLDSSYDMPKKLVLTRSGTVFVQLSDRLPTMRILALIRLGKDRIKLLLCFDKGGAFT